MPRLAERQRGFAEALLDPAQPVPSGLVGPDGQPSPRRFAVYRNNVVAGLTQALRDAFPAVHRIVGADFFRAMAHPYVVMEPPRTPILLDYGEGFPGFIADFAPAAVLPYLADVARIERAWSEAYHAPEAMPLDPATIMSIAPDALPAMSLVLHPSLRVVRSRFPALTIWQMNVGDGVAGPIDWTAGGEDVLVVRSSAEVEACVIVAGSAEFIRALGAGAPVVAALAAALQADSSFDLAASLAGLMQSRAVIGYRTAPDDNLPDGRGAQ
ncbi:DUF2063 domain-containing protein [Bradyrhizobium sp. WD16]|uniref:HvfC/BufC N-terminal domain-containing protein n=1 Tax=Bradyrhizobium sp. WD16 TaxID=1521768 RepID=UPI0020A48146|nr:DNA-binding domain-containing protein [Bradyrhizobium sp. WD16]UTD25733.1 DUF2063 domain-containing protein [Bradyrhizobium sp. WD16]